MSPHCPFFETNSIVKTKNLVSHWRMRAQLITRRRTLPQTNTYHRNLCAPPRHRPCLPLAVRLSWRIRPQLLKMRRLSIRLILTSIRKETSCWITIRVRRKCRTKSRIESNLIRCSSSSRRSRDCSDATIAIRQFKRRAKSRIQTPMRHLSVLEPATKVRLTSTFLTDISHRRNCTLTTIQMNAQIGRFRKRNH